MHNFQFSIKFTKASLTELKKGLHSKKRNFINSNYTRLRKLFVNYNRLAQNDNLHLLTPAMADMTTDSAVRKGTKKDWRDTAYSLYGDRPFVNDHWEMLKNYNGGKSLKCPICGVRDCFDMDHYVPRDTNQFPEYSAHLNNLIPLCHECNIAKGNRFLNKGDRLIFNAFYDILGGIRPIVCNVTLSPIDGNPDVVVSLNPTLDFTRRPGNIIKNTFESLEGLLPFLQEKASDYLRCEINKLIKSSSSVRKEVMSLYPTATDKECIDFLQVEVYKAISSSSEMHSWVKSLP